MYGDVVVVQTRCYIMFCTLNTIIIEINSTIVLVQTFVIVSDPFCQALRLPGGRSFDCKLHLDILPNNRFFGNLKLYTTDARV